MLTFYNYFSIICYITTYRRAEVRHTVEPYDYPTVRELLALPAFSGSRVLAGERGLDRPVAGVSLTDLPDYHSWVYPDELLVSTCYAIHQDAAALAEFIPTLSRKGLAGACIKTARFLGVMPPAMLAAAETLSFPLIELPADVRFSTITKAVADERLGRQTALLRSSLTVNQMLVQTITSGASLEEIAQMAGEITGGTVLLVDSLNCRQVLYLSPADAQALAGLGPQAVEQVILARAEVHEMVVEEQVFGALYLCPAGDQRPLSPELLSQILQTIPLEISRERSIRERERKNFSEFFHHLVSDHILDDAWEQARADTFHLDLSGPHALLALHMEWSHQKHQAVFQRTAFFRSLYQELDQLGAAVHTMDQEDGLFLLLSRKDPETPLEGVLEGLPGAAQRLSAAYPALELSGGYSRSHSGIPGLSLCSWEARLAQKAARNRGTGGLVPFERLGVLRLLYSGDPHREIGKFIQETLQSLAHPSTPHQAELLETLECYFRCLGNQRRMAQALFIHYNTAAYRLRRIQELTQMDLNDPSDRIQLELALYLQRFHTV